WHFAAQHAGVLRIYTRKVGGGSKLLDRYGVRAFVTYTALRTAGWTTGWLEADATTMTWLRIADRAVLSIPALLLIEAAMGFAGARIGKPASLMSLCGLYSSLLLSFSCQWAGGVIALTTASGLFHAVEYLALVTPSADHRRTIGGTGPFCAL